MIDAVQILPGVHPRVVDWSELDVRIEQLVTARKSDSHFELLSTFSSGHKPNGVEITKFMNVQRLVKAVFAVHEALPNLICLSHYWCLHLAGLATFRPI